MCFFGRFARCKPGEHEMAEIFGMTFFVMACIFMSHCTILIHSVEIIMLHLGDLRRKTSTTKVWVTLH